MWLDVYIPKKKNIPFDVLKISKFEALECGIIGCKPVVVRKLTGKFTRLYDPSNVGVAIEIHEEEKTIDISLNYPCGRKDVQTFFYLIEEICTIYHSNTFSIYDQTIDLYDIRNVMQYYMDTSKTVLQSIYKEFQSGKRKEFLVYGAYFPIVLGNEEMEIVKGSINAFVQCIEEIQNLNVHYCEADIYTIYRNQKHYGVYECKLNVPCVLPDNPYFLVNTFDCEVQEWVVKYPYADFRYSDFMKEVQGNRFDEEHIIITLNEEQVDALARKIGYDPIENTMLYYPSYGVPFMDGLTHARKVKEKSLQTDYYNGYTHVAYFLKWCIEHNLLSDKVLDDNPQIENDFMNSLDICKFICENKAFNGRICPYHLNEYGRRFAARYTREQGHNYPAQIDNIARKLMGDKEYINPIYKDEAYLFLDRSDVYYKEVSTWLDLKWKEFINTFH